MGRPHDTWLCQMDRHFAGVGDGPCGGLGDGRQETEGVQLEGFSARELAGRTRPVGASI